MKKVIVCSLIICLCGCAGKFKTARFDADKWEATGNPINGVVYYEPKLVKLTYEFTSIIDNNGKFVGTFEDNKCIKVIQKEELAIYPDYGEPRVLLYEPALLASNEFSVNINNGMLTSINSKSTPLMGEILGKIASLAEAGVIPARGVVTKGVACNSSPMITSIKIQALE